MATINDLPNEIICEVFSYINLFERQQLQIVCKRWRYNIQEMWYPIHKLAIHLSTNVLDSTKKRKEHIANGIHFINANSSDFEAVLKNINGNLRKLELVFKESYFELPNCILKLLNQNKYLNSVRVSGNAISLVKSLKSLPTEHLQHLLIANSRKTHDLNNVIEEILINAPKLTTLFINNTSSLILERISEMDTLKTLHLVNTDGGSGSLNFTRLFNLETLSIGTEQYIDDNFLIELANNCKKLRAIELEDCSLVTKIGWKAIETLPNLRYLRLDEISHNIEILNFFSNLEEFYCQLSLRSDNSALRFLERSPNLKRCYVKETIVCDFFDYTNDVLEWFDKLATDVGFHLELSLPLKLIKKDWYEIYGTRPEFASEQLFLRPIPENIIGKLL